MSAKDWLVDWRYRLPLLWRRAWLFAKYRPVLTCPYCKGAGGAVSGYYEPEWMECACCWPYWDALDDCGCEWAVGRLPPLWWWRAKLTLWAHMADGTAYPARIRTIIRCKVLRRHRWMDDKIWQDDPSGGMCADCFTEKYQTEDAQ